MFAPVTLRLFGVLAASAALFAASVVAPVASRGTSPAGVTVSLHAVTSGLQKPVYMASATDGLSRLFVVQQPGVVRIVSRGKVQASPYLDISKEVNSNGNEQGLLSIAFHPDFKKHPFVYVAYTRSDGALQISRFTASSAKASHLSASTELRYFHVPHAGQENHNGGQLQFGKTGLLYIGTGDGGGGGDPYGRPEKLTSLGGKILRINVDKNCGSRHYCVPTSNPFPHSRSVNKRIVFDWGLRNPWRFSFDRDGTLWIGDVGQDAWEEVDHVRAVGGKDFGWSCREGRASYNSNRCTMGGKARRMTGPKYVYDHSNGRCAIIGGYVYRGPAYPFARGLYVFADYCSGEIWATGRTSSGGYRTALVGKDGAGSVTGFGVADSGEIYLVDQSGQLAHLVFHKT